MMTESSPCPPFTAAYAPDDRVMAARLLETGRLRPDQDGRIDHTATRLIDAIRANDDRLGGIEDMLREFALSTKEGLALMVLAEALLRVPDARTADQFIEDKLGQGDFVHHETKSSAFLVNASAWALGMSARVIQPGETPDGTIGRLAKRLGVPAVRAATRQAMLLMGNHFVLGETIRGTLAPSDSAGRPRYSFCMLGEGARTSADAERYFNSYASAIEAIGRTADNRPLPDRPGISVKLSALHPRFDPLSHERVMTELVPRLIDLARRAKVFDLNFTVDAEEADRLALSLATVLELADGKSGFEFQRLHGMGEALYAQLREDRPGLAYRTYAPVGSHRDLLAYLVRRLLENGANSSFVAIAADDAVPVATLLRRPADIIGRPENARHPNIRLPCDLFQPQRQNSRGIEFGEPAALDEMLSAVAAETAPVAGASLIDGRKTAGTARPVISPIDPAMSVGSGVDPTPEQANAAVAAARKGVAAWSRTPAEIRARILERAADMLEQRHAHFIALLQREGGKTLDDALSEVREATDFCRYYAAEGKKLFGAGETMPGPTGESNVLSLRGRAVFVA